MYAETGFYLWTLIHEITLTPRFILGQVNFFKNICCSSLISCVLIDASGQTCWRELVFLETKGIGIHMIWLERSPALNVLLLLVLGVSHENLLSSLLKDIETHFLPTWHHLWCGWNLHADKYRINGC